MGLFGHTDARGAHDGAEGGILALSPLFLGLGKGKQAT